MPTSNLKAESVVTKDKKSGLPLEGMPDCRSIHYVRGLNLTLQFTVHNSFSMSQATRSVMRSSSPRSTVTLPPACSLPSMMSLDLVEQRAPQSSRPVSRFVSHLCQTVTRLGGYGYLVS